MNLIREVMSLIEPDSWSDYFSVAMDINYKNTCIIILDITVLKDTIFIQLLT